MKTIEVETLDIILKMLRVNADGAVQCSWRRGGNYNTAKRLLPMSVAMAQDGKCVIMQLKVWGRNGEGRGKQGSHRNPISFLTPIYMSRFNNGSHHILVQATSAFFFFSVLDLCMRRGHGEGSGNGIIGALVTKRRQEIKIGMKA